MEKFALKMGNFVLETTRVIPVTLSIIVIALSALGYQLLKSGALKNSIVQPVSVYGVDTTDLISHVNMLDKKISAITSSLEKASGEQPTKIGVESFKWFLGLMITLAIGLVSMGFARKTKSDT